MIDWFEYCSGMISGRYNRKGLIYSKSECSKHDRIVWSFTMNRIVKTKLIPTAPLAITGPTTRSRLRKLYKWLLKQQIYLALNGITFYKGKIYTAFPHAVNSVMQYHCIVCERPFHTSNPMTPRGISRYNHITAYICDSCPHDICERTFFDKSTCARRKVTFALCIRGLIKDIRELLLRCVDKCKCGCQFTKLREWLGECF